MTARGLAVVTGEGSTPLYCRGTLADGSECRQLLARRWPAGGLDVVVKGDKYDADGRVVIVCPLCGHRARVNPRRAA